MKSRQVMKIYSKSLSYFDLFTLNGLISVEWSSADLRRNWSLSALAAIPSLVNQKQVFPKKSQFTKSICNRVFDITENVIV